MNQVRFVITGMPHSGSSLFAHFMHQSGIYLGENIRANTPEIPTFEDPEFLSLHQPESDRLPKAPDFLPPKSLQLKDNWKNEAEEIYLKKCEALKEKPHWGWKQPRTSLFLDFWQQIDPKIHFVFVFRHPTAVVGSLCKIHRKCYSRAYANRLYKSYIEHNQAIAKFIQRHFNFTLVSYESLVSRPQDAIDVLSEDLNFPFQLADFQQVFSPKEHKKKRRTWPMLAASHRTKAEQVYSMLQMQQSF